MSTPSRIPRWARIVVTWLAALLVVFHIAGGWVFSDMIHAEALTPLGPTPDYGVYVRAFDEAQQVITLAAAEEREDIGRPGVSGLAWEGGSAILGDVKATAGLEVTRDLLRLAGSPPPVCTGPLDGCDQVDIRGAVFENDPSEMELDFEEVEFESRVGHLGAWQVDSGDGKVWAIHVHGWNAARNETIRMLTAYREAGITSLVIDYRNDPGAPPDPSGLYRFGRTEWEDLEAAVGYAVDNGAERIVLAGYSTGAAISMAFLEKSELADLVDALVFDSPNLDMAATIRNEASKRTIPGTAIPVPGTLIWVALEFADFRWDVNWGEIDYVSRADGIVAVPTLVFHGLKDTRVPVEVSRRFEEAVPDLVRLEEFENGGHVTNWNVDATRYAAVLGEFLDEVDG